MSRIRPQPPTEGSENISVEQMEDTPYIEDFWLRIAREAYEESSDWVDSNLRDQWEKSISLFNSKHPPGSKYNTGAYDKRSRFFRPKTRTAVRNLQSAMAVAFFTNEDVVSVQPRNPNDPDQVAAAAVSQSIMQYRLTNTLPWFQTMSAALQDAAVQGICVSHQYWEYEEKEEAYLNVDSQNRPVMDADGNPVVTKQKTSIKDKPIIDLISPENIRIDPAADWHDPMESSPYIIHLMPMYVQDVRQKMIDGEWLDIPIGELLASDTDEEKELNLLYRKKRVYSIGHGTSVQWETQNDSTSGYETVSKVWTSVLPEYDLRQVAPTSHVMLSMLELSDLGNWETAKDSLIELRNEYQSWILRMESSLDSEDLKDYHEAAKRNIDKCCIELLRLLLTYCSDKSGLAQKLIADSEDLRDVLYEPNENHKIFKGWRKEVFGNYVSLLLEGKLAFSIENKKIKKIKL